MNEWYAFDKLCEAEHGMGQIRTRFSIAERELKGTEYESEIISLNDNLEAIECKLQELTGKLYRNLREGR